MPSIVLSSNEPLTEAVTAHDRADRTPPVTATATDTKTMRRLFGLAVAAFFIGWLDTAFLVGVHYAALPLPGVRPSPEPAGRS